MILFLQFTVTDTRRFSQFSHELLDKPQWPTPIPFSEFVRTTGKIVERSKGGLPGWVGENTVCKIGKSITITNDLRFSNGITGVNISKHMYAQDRYILTKYEFVFNLKTTRLVGKVTHDVIKTIVNELLARTVKIKLKGSFSEIPISMLPDALREFHVQNTTIGHHNIDPNSASNVIRCTPQMYFYLERSEWADALERNYTRISNVGHIAQLFCAWHDHKNRPIRIWIHHRLRKAKEIEENRELRMKILRLHSEYECLRNVIWSISKGFIKVDPRSIKSNELQYYLNVTIRKFLRDEKNFEFYSFTDGFFDYFSKIFARATPGDLESIYNKIKEFDFRKNIKDKIILITKNINVSTKFENHNSNIISQGNNNVISDNQISQTVNQSSPTIDFDNLSSELSAVLAEAKRVATTTADLQSVVALSEVKDASDKKDGNGVIKALKACGKFALDVANKLTASVIIELMKSHTTLLQ